MLWQALRRGLLDGLHFRRQHAIDRFVLDFYCAKHKLAIEVDGGVHDDPAQAERDVARTRALELRGIHIVRVRNSEVVPDTAPALARIRSAVAVLCRDTHQRPPRAPD